MTLGISVSSRLVGLAVLHQDALVDYRIKLFKEHWNPGKLTHILNCIEQYIDEFKVTQVALLLPLRHYATAETRILLLHIPLLCKAKNRPSASYTLKDLSALIPNGHTKKKALMQALSLLYPELLLAKKRELSSNRHYYSKLFEAVGVATIHERKLQSKYKG